MTAFLRLCLSFERDWGHDTPLHGGVTGGSARDCEAGDGEEGYQ
jgi:hypothetical protein